MTTNTAYEHYYVPENSRFPILASVGLATMVFGAASMINAATAGESSISALLIFLAGAFCLSATLYFWFSVVINEGQADLYSRQLKRSQTWAMLWFILSEVMFFGAFFGALFYVRMWVLPWLDGDGGRGPSDMLWPAYSAEWPLLNTPDSEQFPGAHHAMGPWPLPLINTVILVLSSVTVTIAHHGLNEKNRSKLIAWLAFTVALGVIFLMLQAYEYYEAYSHLGLTLNAGIYGTTFFMLTGFHGAHVTLGTFMLICILVRACRGAFPPDKAFGFEAVAWYWHFVDVVWLALFILVYVFGS